MFPITHSPLCRPAVQFACQSLLAAMLLCAGCREPAQPPAAPAQPSLSGAVVAVAAPAELHLSEQWSLQLDEWSAATGAECRLTELESSRATPAAGTALAIVPLGQIPELVAADWMAPITDDDAIADWETSFRSLRSGFTRPGGEPALIPVACPVLACYYRADLLEAAGRRPPETWDDYQKLLDDLGGWSNGLPAFEPWSAEFRSTMLLARAAPYALHPDSVAVLLDLQSASPLIADPPFVQALEDSIEALQRLDRQSLEMGPTECCQAVQEGRAALAIGIPPAAGATGGERSDPAAVVGTVRLPGAARVYDRATGAWAQPPDGAGSHVTVVGFGGHAVCAARSGDDATLNAAWNLWNSMRASTNDDDLPFGPAVCRNRDAAAALRKPAGGFTSAEWRQHVEVTTAVLQETRVLLDLPLPERERFRDLLTAQITLAIEGTATPAAALEQAARDWLSLIEELDSRRNLNVYRQCHGLKPL